MNLITYKNELKRVRRELHRIPEPGFEEFSTQAYIMAYLEKSGFSPVKTAKTGVLCFIDKGCPKTAALRSDMDALPLTELAISDFKSEHDGYMHACGHDGHMAMLLVFAKFISENDIKCSENILLVFQPAEEGPGGAKVIIEEGVFEKYNVSRIYGFHMSPDYPAGFIATRPGRLFASGVELFITVNGKAGHAAQPEKAVNALLAAAGLVPVITALLEPESVVTIGKMNSGIRKNVIADKAELEGIMRSFDESQKSRILDSIKNACTECEAKHGVNIDFNPVQRYPVLINDEALYSEAVSRLGEKLLPADESMLSEDFAFYGKKCPSLFMLVGINDGDEKYKYPLHSPYFNFNEEHLLNGLEAYIKLIND